MRVLLRPPFEGRCEAALCSGAATPMSVAVSPSERDPAGRRRRRWDIQRTAASRASQSSAQSAVAARREAAGRARPPTGGRFRLGRRAARGGARGLWASPAHSGVDASARPAVGPQKASDQRQGKGRAGEATTMARTKSLRWRTGEAAPRRRWRPMAKARVILEGCDGEGEGAHRCARTKSLTNAQGTRRCG